MKYVIHDLMMSVYRNEKPDCVPVAAYTRYIPRGCDERMARDAGLGIIDYVPVSTMLAPPWHMLEGYLSEVRGADISVSYSWRDGVRIERRSFATARGELYSEIEQDAGGVGSEHIVKRYVTSPSDYSLLRDIARNTVFSDNSELLSARMRDLGGDGVVLARLDRSAYQKLLIELVGPEQLFYDMADDADAIEELIALLDDRLYQAALRAFDSEAEAVWLPDNVTSDMTPPRVFDKYCLPYYRRLGELSAQTGKPLLAHFDGKVGVLRDAINQSGITGIDSLSLPEMGGDLTLEQARAAFPGKGLMINFPSNRSFDDGEEIARWVREFCACAADAMPCMLQLSEDVPREHWAKVACALARGAGEVNGV